MKPRIYPTVPQSKYKSISSFLHNNIVQCIGFGTCAIVVSKNILKVAAGAPTASTIVIPIVDNENTDRCKQYYNDYQECIYSGQDCDLLYERYIRCITEASQT